MKITREEMSRQAAIAQSLRPRLQGKKALVRTFGCQQNEADGERILGQLVACGYAPADSIEEADMVILNTCAIREHAEQRVLGVIGSMKKQKEKNPAMLMGMCGCMAQEPHRQELLLKSYPFVDFLFGTDMHHRIPEILQETLDARKQKQFVSRLPHGEFGVVAEGEPLCRDSFYKAKVSVMYGCNNFCSYCIVPYVRGHERSRDSADVLRDVEGLVNSGYRDVMLLGQNVNSYRGELTFPQLLDKCASFGGEYWVRFMTSHPKDASSELIRAVAENEKISRHFHLPFQSGNDRILTAMNRKYSRQQYLEKALAVKEQVKDVSLTSDVIVGFPTETEEEFLDTVSLVEQVGFDMLYTFIYSPRKGTVAEKMEGHIPHEEQVKRFEYLSQVQNRIAQKNNDAFVGRTLRVLSEGVNEKGIPTGRSSGNKIVTFDTPVPEGDFCNVTIDTAKQYALSGTIKKENH